MSTIILLFKTIFSQNILSDKRMKFSIEKQQLYNKILYSMAKFLPTESSKLHQN